MRQSIFSSALLVLLSIASKIGSSTAQLVDQERPERRGLKKYKTKKSVKSTKSSKKCKVEKSPPKKGVKSPKACKGVDTTYEPKIIPPSGDITNPDFLAAARRCGAAILTAGFDFFDLDNYDKWFDDASILYLKETGYYQGPENISEYVRFVFSELFEYYYKSSPLVPLPLVADGDTCVISFATVNSMAVKEEYSSVEGDPSADTIVGYRVSFTITSPDLSTVNISNIHLYYPPGFLQFLFDDVLGGEAVARRTCNILETACSDTFYEKNCYNKVDECFNDVMTLPRTDGDNIDGKTMGCRTLHADFASVNDKHCPHISFLPEYDVNCFLKCQETANNVLADVFHPMELGLYKSVAVSAGIGEAEFVSPSIFPPTP